MSTPKKPARAKVRTPSKAEQVVAAAPLAAFLDEGGDIDMVSIVETRLTEIRLLVQQEKAVQAWARTWAQDKLRQIAIASLTPTVYSLKARSSSQNFRPKNDAAAGATTENARAFAAERGYPGKTKYQVILAEGADHFRVSQSTFARRLAGK